MKRQEAGNGGLALYDDYSFQKTAIGCLELVKIKIHLFETRHV
ncbi:hypothetical protein [Paenibacillus apiarius]|nr:hypothetical protein [Paenibacillus apiarius]